MMKNHSKTYLIILCLLVLKTLLFSEDRCLKGDLKADIKLSKSEITKFSQSNDILADDEDIYDKNFDFFINSGTNAYQLGFFDLSKKFFSKALNLENLSNLQKLLAAMGVIDSSLSSGRFFEVINEFDNFFKLEFSDVPQKIKHRFFLRLAILECFRRDFTHANKTILRIDIRHLNEDEIPWYYGIQAVIQAAFNNFEGANLSFEESKKHSVSVDQQLQIQTFFIQFLLQSRQDASETNALLFKLDSLYKNHKLEKSGYPFVKAYALVLSKNGMIDKANEILDLQISNIPDRSSADLQAFKLYKAIVNGPQTEDGISKIFDIIQTSDYELQCQALKLLIVSSEADDQKISLIKKLSQLNLQQLSTDIIRQVLFARLRLAVEANTMELAQQAALDITSHFPKDSLLKNVYQALAYLAWRGQPKDYRTTAYYLKEMAAATSDPYEKIVINTTIGNVFYLSKEYSIAAEIYKEILQSNLQDIQYDKILCQLIQSHVKSDNLTAAKLSLLDFHKVHNIFSEYVYNAELMYVTALLDHRNFQLADDHLSEFLNEYSAKINPFFLIKFYLLQARLMSEMKNYQRAHIFATKIYEMFPQKVVSSDIADIVTQALFLKGASELQFKNLDSATETFFNLRKHYPNSESAALSYFEEANYFFEKKDETKAQSILLDFASSNSMSKYFPFAYYQCAEICKSRGLNHFNEAISHLSTLITKYPDHKLVYAARLKIAELLNLSGRFSDAELVYEELLKDFPLDPRTNFVEFCLAKMIFAQKKKGPLFSERSQIILEQLYSKNAIELSLKLEIIAMYCFVLRENEKQEEAKRVAWATILSNISNENQLTKTNIYWLLQIANILRTCLSATSNYTEFQTLQRIITQLKTCQ